MSCDLIGLVMVIMSCIVSLLLVEKMGFREIIEKLIY